MDDVSDYRLFVAIVTSGSLSETARRSSASLPAVSRRLAKFEARLGVRLIDRGSRHFALTQEGQLLHQRAVQILADIEETEAEISNRVLSPRGHLRVAAPSEIGRTKIAAMVADFGDRHPDVTIELRLSDVPLEQVGEDFDIGLHVDRPKSATTVCRKLLRSRRVLCASPTYLARHGVPTKPDDLSRHHCLKLIRSDHGEDKWLFSNGKVVSECFVKARLATSCSDVMHQWALGGHGIAQKALWDIHDDLSAGRLISLLPDYFCMDLDLYVTFPSSRRLPARTRMLIDYIAAGLVPTTAG